MCEKELNEEYINMCDFSELKLPIQELYQVLALKTEDQLNDLVRDGGFVLAKNVSAKDLNFPPLATGWMLTCTKPKQEGLPRTFFIRYTTPTTKRIWLQGQKRIAERAGLEPTQVLRWCKSRITQKYELLDCVSEVIQTPRLKETYLNYNPDFSKEDFVRWKGQYEINDRFWLAKRSRLKELLLELLSETPQNYGQE